MGKNEDHTYEAIIQVFGRSPKGETVYAGSPTTRIKDTSKIAVFSAAEYPDSPEAISAMPVIHDLDDLLGQELDPHARCIGRIDSNRRIVSLAQVIPNPDFLPE